MPRKPDPFRAPALLLGALAFLASLLSASAHATQATPAPAHAVSATTQQQRPAYRVARMADGWALLRPVKRGRTRWVPTHQLPQRVHVGDVVRACTRPVPSQGRTVRWCRWGKLTR